MNYNAEALIFVMRPPEATVQILMNAVNGVGSIPGVGSMSPRLILSELTGMALCNFYAARGVPPRSNVTTRVSAVSSMKCSNAACICRRPAMNAGSYRSLTATR